MKRIPKFKNESEERAFWQAQDSSDYIDWKHASSARFPNLRPSTKTVSIRLPKSLIEEIKRLAAKRDVPYQSLLKILLADSVSRHRHS